MKPHPPHSVVVIAEAGVNHNGSMELALKLVEAAAQAGADYVKFQTFDPEKLVAPRAPKAGYQIANTGNESQSMLDMLRPLVLSPDDHYRLRDACTRLGIGFLSTAFDPESLELLARLDMDYVKVPSGELDNLPYLQACADLGKPLLLSTGMGTLGEVETALKVLEDAGCPPDNVVVLHCTSIYPAPPETLNLRALHTLQTALGVRVGYSDHSLGIEMSLAAVAMGAVVIEKHLTLDRNLPGPDHAASLVPDELRQMIAGIRNLEKALGHGRKQPHELELPTRALARRSLHLRHPVEAGHELKASDLHSLRPADGLSPMELPRVVGRRVRTALPAHHVLSWADLD